MASVNVANENLVVPYGTAWQLADGLAIPAGEERWTDALDLSQAFYFGAWLRAVGDDPNVAAEWEESPTLEKADFVKVADVHGGFGATPVIVQLTPPPMRYGRLKLTAAEDAGADTVVDAWLFIQGAAA